MCMSKQEYWTVQLTFDTFFTLVSKVSIKGGVKGSQAKSRLVGQWHSESQGSVS